VTSVTTADGTPDAATVTYAYDAAGHRTQVTDTLGHVTRYTCDPAGNYDAAGRCGSGKRVGKQAVNGGTTTRPKRWEGYSGANTTSSSFASSPMGREDGCCGR
jgi:YD repeat-containing protein